MTWKAFHNRGEILRAVIATADVRRDGILPLDIPGAGEAFHDELDLLGALMLKWHARMSGHVERELAVQPLDLRAAVATAWARAAEELAGVRAILDHYREQPVDAEMARVIDRAAAKEHQFLAVMAGLSGLGEPDAAAVGAEIERAARLQQGVLTLDARAATDDGPRRASLLDRLRAVVAA